jgi:hypothetical protein
MGGEDMRRCKWRIAAFAAVMPVLLLCTGPGIGSGAAAEGGSDGCPPIIKEKAEKEKTEKEKPGKVTAAVLGDLTGGVFTGPYAVDATRLRTGGFDGKGDGASFRKRQIDVGNPRGPLASTSSFTIVGDFP